MSDDIEMAKTCLNNPIWIRETWSAIVMDFFE
jgi:hypothetical protein